MFDKLKNINLIRLIISSLLFSSFLFLISVYVTKFQDIDFLLSKMPIAAIFLLLPLQELVFRGILRTIFGPLLSALAFSLVLATFYSTSLGNFIFLGIAFFIMGMILNFLAENETVLANVVAQELLIFFYILTSENPYSSTFILSSFLITLPIYWHVWKGSGILKALNELGIKKENLVKNILIGIGTTASAYIISIIIAIVLTYLGLHDAELVKERVQTFPGYLLAFAILIAPISEELFFRGFLIPRIGIILSSLAFAFAHTQYGSISEITAAFAIGMLFGYSFLLTRSLVTPIVAHSLFNLVSITLMRLVS